jgi:hypothetical protein
MVITVVTSLRKSGRALLGGQIGPTLPLGADKPASSGGSCL